MSRDLTASSPQTDERARFGALRALLQGPPGAQTWAKLLDCWDAWPDGPGLREQALPYARDHLARWPSAQDAARVWSPRWLERLSARQGAPWAPLARAFRFEAASMSRFAQTVAATLLPYAGHLTHLELEGCRPLTQALRLLLELASPRLQTLSLESVSLPLGQWSELVQGLRLPALGALKLSRSSVDDAGLAAFLAALDPQRLRTLELSHARNLTAPGLGALLSWPGRLDTLEVTGTLQADALDELLSRLPSAHPWRQALTRALQAAQALEARREDPADQDELLLALAPLSHARDPWTP